MRSKRYNKFYSIQLQTLLLDGTRALVGKESDTVYLGCDSEQIRRNEILRSAILFPVYDTSIVNEVKEWEKEGLFPCSEGRNIN